MHLEHLGDSLVRGGRGQWMVSVARKRVSLGFNLPPKANGVDDSMPRSTVSNLCCGAPMNWGTLRVLASREIAVPNPNGMWSLKNEIGYFRSQHHRPVAFDSSLIALTSFELWPSEDRPRNALRAPWYGVVVDDGWSLWLEQGCDYGSFAHLKLMALTIWCQDQWFQSYVVVHLWIEAHYEVWQWVRSLCKIQMKCDL